MRMAALAAGVALAGCGRDGAEDDASAAPAAADTSAMGAARRVLGTEVLMAVPFRLQHRDVRFIAAAVPVRDDSLRAAGAAAEMVVVEIVGDAQAVQKPGLYASREPFAEGGALDSARLARVTGVEDANGDGDAEVWAAQFHGTPPAHTWTVRAFDRGGRALYQMVALTTRRGGADSVSFYFSDNVARDTAVRAWLARKARDLEARRVAAEPGP